MLEYLLGQHCATDAPTLISEGLELLRRILAKQYVHRNQAQLVRSTIKERGTHKVIDKLTVELGGHGSQAVRLPLHREAMPLHRLVMQAGVVPVAAHR